MHGTTAAEGLARPVTKRGVGSSLISAGEAASRDSTGRRAACRVHARRVPAPAHWRGEYPSSRSGEVGEGSGSASVVRPGVPHRVPSCAGRPWSAVALPYDTYGIRESGRTGYGDSPAAGVNGVDAEHKLDHLEGETDAGRSCIQRECRAKRKDSSAVPGPRSTARRHISKALEIWPTRGTIVASLPAGKSMYHVPLTRY